MAFFKDVFRVYVLESDVGVYTILNAVFFALPIIVLLAIFWKKAISAEPDKFNKFIFLLCPATLVSIVFMTLLAWGARFFFYSYIVQIGLLLYFIANKNETVMKVIGEVTDFCKKHTLVSAVAVIYFAVFFK